jgi:hypothetical protein
LPQPDHNTISEMMENYANEAVRRSGEFEAALDYSEGSLRTLESILGQVSATLPKPDSHKTDLKDSAQEQIDTASRMWGGYFGETIRRLWGGDWGVETYPGTVAPVVSIDIGGAKLFPVMKVYRRLTQGEDENVWKFYQMVRERVAAKGGRQ